VQPEGEAEDDVGENLVAVEFAAMGGEGEHGRAMAGNRGKDYFL
jgi:hypothetical protein